MAKSKTFKSNHDGPITVAVPNALPVTLKPDGTIESDDQHVIAALSANPDVSESRKQK